MGGREGGGGYRRHQRVALRALWISRGGRGGAIHGGEGGTVIGLNERPGKAVVWEVSPRSCSLVFMFSETALEEPFTAPERTSEEA
jgi:hypothetical protein